MKNILTKCENDSELSPYYNFKDFKSAKSVFNR